MGRNREEPLVLLHAAAERMEGRRVLVVDLPEPERARATVEALPAAELRLVFTRWDALQAALLGGQEATFALNPESDEAWDCVVLFLPHGKERLRELAWTSGRLLSPGGELLVIGANRAGIRSAPKVLGELFEEVTRIESARHCQVHRATGSLEVELPPAEVVHEVEVAGVRLTVVTRPGVFSADGLDPGTQLLLEHLPEGLTGRIVDVGSGAGVIGASLGRRSPSAEITCCDVDAAALAATRATLAANEVAADVVASDVLDGVDGRLDVVVSNPPFHQGVQTEYGVGEKLVRQAARRLGRRGTLFLVCNRFLRYNQWMEECFQQVSCLADDGRYQVWRAAMPRRVPAGRR